ncbi:hypothetical protein Dimus_003790 [Dionaea muscipula]
MSHNRKKDVAKFKVRGVEIVFDHLQLASILGIPEQGEFGLDDQFFDAQVDVEEPVTEPQAAPAVPVPSTVQQKETTPSGVDPSCPTGRIPEVVMNKMQTEFERARANRFQADLEKAQAKNARLLALLHQAQSKPKP